jgi:hypothetical protein
VLVFRSTISAVAALVLAATCFAAPRIECPSTPTEVNRDVKNNFEASVGRILGLKAAELRNETSVVARQLLSRVPNADRVYVAQMMTSVFCQQLSVSTISHTEKLNRINEFTNRIAILVSTQAQQEADSTRISQVPPTAAGRTSAPKINQNSQKRDLPLDQGSAMISEALGSALLSCEERAQKNVRNSQESFDALLREKQSTLNLREEFSKEKHKISDELATCRSTSNLVIQGVAQDKLNREWQSPPPKIFVDQRDLRADCVKASAKAFSELKFDRVTEDPNSVSGIQGPYQLYMLCYAPMQQLIIAGPDIEVARKIVAMVRGAL